MAEDVILSVKNISKSFGDLQVLKEISFDIHKGEKIAILGPSGSGKSIILRCINQLETYDSGEIDYMGKPVNSGQALHELRQHIGMVFQRFNVFTHMSVLQNVIEAPVHVKKVPKQEAIAKAKDLLKMVGLEGREEAMAKNLSGGQQQRVAERLQKVDAVFRQKGKVKERRRRHADKEVAPPRGKIHGRDLLSDV